ncbi:MAG: DUF6399 domain-containing protein [Cyanobacteria bacterium P01_D01_bin.44]
MSLTIRERSQKVVNSITPNVRQTLKTLAAATELSVSSVHRHRRAIHRRNQYPESSFWETEVGYQWLVRLVFGLIYYFGIKQGVGAESLSEFIHAIRLDTHVASSASSLRQLKHRANQTLIDYATAQAEHCQPSAGQGICVGADETFFGLEAQTQDLAIREWVLMALLPWVYWTQQADKTRQSALKHRYQQAASCAFDWLLEQSITLKLDANQLEHWVLWCREFCAKYQRTSSAVEGRNGYLSKLHQAGRGFSEQSLKVLTIIHNFDLKRSDGTTAAQRLFGYAFPDPFEWMLDHVGDLPMPRRSSKAQQPKPLYANAFAA